MVQKLGTKMDTEYLLILTKHIGKEKRPKYIAFVKQFMRDYHPAVSEAYLDKEIQNIISV